MNDDRLEHTASLLDDAHRTPRVNDILRFAHAIPLSTALGCFVAAACLLPVVEEGLLAAWLGAGLIVALGQWQSQRLLNRARVITLAADDAARRRRWIGANALVSGVFWGVSSVALFPASSVAHQLLFAFVLVAIAALWLPLFAFTRLALLAFAVPGLLPMAFALVLPQTPPQTTMGSLLLLLIVVLAVAAHTTRRIFFADSAARRELYRQATQDSLVGLANRAEFHRRARQLDIMGERPYAMVFIDLDHFKEVNDTAGHAAGDELLCHIGAVLKDAVRKQDLAARLGGDEFAILMHDCSSACAAQVAANVLERIRGFALTSGGTRRRMSASIGIACSTDLFASPSKLLEAADRACYAAKRGGRNRIEIATGLNASPPRRADTAHFAFVTNVPA
jgi:diguanylate cyclase (GGDEF)-like protein